MKQHLISITLLLILPYSLFAQTLAITEYGDTIYVFDNGRWSFDKDSDVEDTDTKAKFLDYELEIDTSDLKYILPKSAHKQMVSKYDFFTVNYDGELWRRVPPGELNDDAEFALKGIESEIFCIVIAEEIALSAEAILKVALQNMEEYTGAKPEILVTEVREVNGSDLLKGRFRVNVSGLDLIFDSYYYSNEFGTIQFTTWTGANLADKYNQQIEDLLNGIVITKE